MDNHITIYDEVFEYLINEGFSEEESHQIMVDFVAEGGGSALLKGLGAVAKFVQRRASTPLRTAATDVATTALTLGGSPTGAKLSTTAARAASPTPIVRTVKAPTIRNAPKASNVAPDPWKQPSAPRTAKPSSTPARTPSTPKALTGSPTPRALSGTPQARAALPSSSSASGGALAKATPSGALAKATPSGALAKATPSGQITPVAKPGALAKQTPKPTSVTSTAKPGALARTAQRSTSVAPSSGPRVSTPSSARIEPVNVRDITSTRSLQPSQQTNRLLGSAKPSTTQVRSQQFRDVQRLNQMNKGGLIGELPKASASKTPAPKVTPQADPIKSLPSSQTTRSAKPSPKTPGLSTPGGKFPRGFGGLVGPAAAGAALGVAADMAFPRSTAPGTRDAAPKIPTSAKEVKKGETYYDPSTRVGSSQRFAQRKKVGQKIVGPKIVGPKLSSSQDFDRAYGEAKKKGGMGSSFTWRGGQYKVD